MDLFLDVMSGFWSDVTLDVMRASERTSIDKSYLIFLCT